MTDPMLGLTMLGLIVVMIMMGFPTAFTLMGLGMVFGFVAYFDPAEAWTANRAFDLMVQRTYGVMTNDTLLSVPLFVFMGYIIERAALVDQMFHSVQLAFRRLPASLAVATLLVSTFWGIASGIVGAVVVLMGVIAMRPMLAAGYDTRMAAGVITAGGTLGILIPPSVMLIVYAAVSGVSVVKLYAAAMVPGFLLAFLYLVYVIGWAIINPKVAPKLDPALSTMPVPPPIALLHDVYSSNVIVGLVKALLSPARATRAAAPEARSTYRSLLGNLGAALFPLVFSAAIFGSVYWYVVVYQPASQAALAGPAPSSTSGPALAAPLGSDQLRELGSGATPLGGGLSERRDEPLEVGQPASGLAERRDEPLEMGRPASLAEKRDEPVEMVGGSAPAPAASAADLPNELGAPDSRAVAAAADSFDPPQQFFASFWVSAAAVLALILFFYWHMTHEHFVIMKLLIRSVMPLAVLTVVVLAVILMGITTATESAAVGVAGALLLALFSRKFSLARLKESVYLTSKTTAMVCWLFVGSALFSAVFAVHGGQQVIEHWVLSMDLSPTQFMLLSQAIIFFLGWPLEWTEIIVIFVPIFIPLLTHFNIDPILFGVLVAVNLQAAFLSPPVAMSAFYLKGVSPPHVTLNQIFAGMMPYMLIIIFCMVLIYIWPGMVLWLPNYLYR